MSRVLGLFAVCILCIACGASPPPTQPPPLPAEPPSTPSAPVTFATATEALPEPQPELLIGYLSRDPVSNELILDLPHFDQGALRYVLRGDLVASLVPALGLSPLVVTEGDIRSDGDTTKTMKAVAGGAGCKRSEVRFSSVLAAVEGTAEVLVAQAPNDAHLYRREHGVDLEARLPYGGVLYELRLTALRFTLSTKEWRTLEAQTLLPLANKASYSLHRRKVEDAAALLLGIAAVLEEELGAAAKRLALHDELTRAAIALQAPATAPERACQDAAAILSGPDILPNRLYPVLRKGLVACGR